MIRVKICGLMREEDIITCAEAGVHAVGFVTEYPVPVPWNLTQERARKLTAAVPPFMASCMVTAGSPGKVIELAGDIRPDIVQLHGDETIEETAEIAAALKRIGIRCVKALRVDESGRLRFSVDDPAEAARRLSETGISAILVDSCSAARPGGTGLTCDMRVYDAVRGAAALPVMAGGGLRPENLAAVLGARRPYAIDVLTGAETAFGIKDREKISALMTAAQKLWEE